MPTVTDADVSARVPTRGTGVEVSAPCAPVGRPARGHEVPHDRPVLVWALDLAALLPLMVVLPGLTDQDGGRGIAATWLLGMAAATALPVVWCEVRRLPRVAVVLLTAWAGSLVLGVAAANHRADMVLPLLQYSIAPVLVLAARRVWRRPWGPAVLVGLLAAALARYQVRSWLDWWAQTSGGTGLWRPLSWRNPSAALTGIFGVWFLGVSLMSTRVVRVGVGLLAATGFAGTWLSSSRAGLAVTTASAVVVTVVAVRAARVHGHSVLDAVATATFVALATAGVVAGLLAMQPQGSGQALASRDQSVERNTLARLEHTEAALGMFLDRPLTGQGLGSYDTLAFQWNDSNGNLTSSAHNEYAEVAGETGVLGLVALAGALGGLAMLGLQQLRRPPPPRSLTDLRPGLAVGATGAAALFLVHSAVDFDWHYPVLSGLAAVATAVLLPDVPRSATSRWLTRLSAGLLSALLLTGLALAAVEKRSDAPPWAEDAFLVQARDALADGRPEDALAATADALRWNPSSPAARSLRALAQYEMDDDVEGLLAAVSEHPTWFSGRARAAMALARDGHLAVAADLAAALHEDLDTHAAWRVSATRLMVVEAEVVLTAAESCPSAEQLVAAWSDGEGVKGRSLPPGSADVLAEHLSTEGCG